MSHWIAISSEQFTSARQGIKGLSAMQVDNTAAGIGILLKDLGGPFEEIKSFPILSGIFSETGIRRLDSFMTQKGFRTKYRKSFKRSGIVPAGMPKRDVYLVRAYEYPDVWEEEPLNVKLEKLVQTRIQIKEMGREEQDMVVFSFWPDTILIKETGDPMQIASHLSFDKDNFFAKLMMMYSGHDTYADAHPYSCNPFFLKGFATMGSGENTALKKNKEFLFGCDYIGYDSCVSNANTFTHILHYTTTELNFGIEAYKHILTPLSDSRIKDHPDSTFLKHLKQTCRQMIIDGPNCIVGCLPDNTLFMLQDGRKRCPGIIGGKPGCHVFASDPCGLDAILPERNKEQDLQPMHMDTAATRQGKKLEIFRQTDPLLKN